MARAPADIRSLARSQTRLCVTTLISVMTNPKAMSSAKVAAAREMLNRGWGAPRDESGDQDAKRVIVNILQLATGEAQQVEIPQVSIRQLATDDA